MKISDTIERARYSLKERGIPDHSHFRVSFGDGSERTEHDTNWSSFSESVVVGYFGVQKRVWLSKHPVARIEANHDGLQGVIDVPVGCRAYQAIRGETTITGSGRQDRIIGRTIGVVKDGEVIEELYINGLTFRVEGLRK